MKFYKADEISFGKLLKELQTEEVHVQGLATTMVVKCPEPCKYLVYYIPFEKESDAEEKDVEELEELFANLRDALRIRNNYNAEQN